jgi:dTDP-glucose pyrophosphorylase
LSFISRNPCIASALDELEKAGIRDVQIVSGSNSDSAARVVRRSSPTS